MTYIQYHEIVTEIKTAYIDIRQKGGISSYSSQFLLEPMV